jgi:predicted PilT family ATPase
MKPGETMRQITLKGSGPNVAKLNEKIQEIINIAQAPKVAARVGPRLDHSFLIKVVVPNDKVGIIIGRQGSTLRGIQERTRATIHIPPAADEDNSEVRTITIGADIKEDADAAQMEIFLALQQQQQQQAAAASATLQQQQPTNAICISIPDDKVFRFNNLMNLKKFLLLLLYNF